MTMTRHAKILATLGPSSNDPATLHALMAAGARAFRLNFSHGVHADHEARVKMVRDVAAERGHEVTLLQDLQGPKIRVGVMAEAHRLNEDDTLRLDSDATPGTAERVCLPHPEILASLRVKDVVFINDGVIRLEVTAVGEGWADTVVRAGGMLSSRKGVNVPGRALPFAALTDKDKEDLKLGLELGVDWVALSFVQRAADVHEAKALIKGKAAVMAKIETHAAVNDLEAIVAAADGIMIARGDLGVELPTEEVPPLQKKMIRLCRDAGKPVVVATQMLESMISQPVPTRAEASDVANAAYEGADCLMLSAESASGAHPVAAVATMAKIIERVENSSAWVPLLDARPPATRPTVADAMSAAACSTAEIMGAKAIVILTESGGSALRVERWRPSISLLALTPHAAVARRMGLQWGVRPVVVRPVKDTDDMVELASQVVREMKVAAEGDTFVIAAGVPFGHVGTTNMVRAVTL